MIKIKIIQTCLVVSFLCLWLYLDICIHLESLYWLIGKCVACLIIQIVVFVIRISKKEQDQSIWPSVFLLCFWLIWLGQYSYQETARYNRTVFFHKFGKEFNYRRRNLGFPQIPSSWTIDDPWSSRHVEWKAKTGIIGHTSKYISFESGQPKFEDDDYELKSVNNFRRYISIRSQYAKGQSNDSIFYRFESGNNYRLIARKQADSILNAENIKKDY